MAESPVLLLLFNRPDLTQGLISILQSVRPEKIYVAVDGPRPDKPGEEEKVRQVLEIARSIDWTSDIQFLIRERNMGCAPAINAALNWFFDQEEQGIILEDDCHPSPDFFPFCNEMLVRYADDHRIAAIGGHSYVPNELRHPNGYFFSQYMQFWGWASWRRFWNTYDFRLESLPVDDWKKIIQDHTTEGVERAYWIYALEEVLAQRADSWDFQAQFCIWRDNQVGIIPGNNLISNMGHHRGDATHTIYPTDHACRETVALSGLFPEQPVVVDRKKDRRNFLAHLLATECSFSFYISLQDSELIWLKKDRERLEALTDQLTELNHHLTETSRQQHDYIQQLTEQRDGCNRQIAELVASRSASAEAFQAKIGALEEQLHKTRKGWITSKWKDLFFKTKR